MTSGSDTKFAEYCIRIVKDMSDDLSADSVDEILEAVQAPEFLQERWTDQCLRTWSVQEMDESIRHAAFGLVAEAGEAVGVVDKSYHSQAFDSPKEVRQRMLDELSDTFYYLLVLMRMYDVTFTEMMHYLTIKLLPIGCNHWMSGEDHE